MSEEKHEPCDLAFKPGPKTKSRKFPSEDDPRLIEDKDREEYKQLNQDHYKD